MDRLADDRQHESQPQGRRRIYAPARARRGVPAGADRPDQRRAGGVRDARCRGEGHAGALFHVRRQALRPRRMVVAAARRADGRPPGRGQGDGRARRGQPEGAGNGLPGGAQGVPHGGGQAAGQSRAGGRGGGGNRLAQLRRDRQPARCPRRARESGRDHHSLVRPVERGTGRPCCSAPRGRSNCS